MSLLKINSPRDDLERLGMCKHYPFTQTGFSNATSHIRVIVAALTQLIIKLVSIFIILYRLASTNKKINKHINRNIDLAVYGDIPN